MPRLLYHTSVGWRLSGAACVVFISLAACGPTTPDNNAVHGAGTSATHALSTAQAAGHRETDRETKHGVAVENQAAANSIGQSDKQDGRNREVPSVSELVLKDLDSQDSSTRLRALDHWTTKGTTASLDPVFEAMEDKDEAVRARATALVEQLCSPSRSGQGERLSEHKKLCVNSSIDH